MTLTVKNNSIFVFRPRPLTASCHPPLDRSRVLSETPVRGHVHKPSARRSTQTRQYPVRANTDPLRCCSPRPLGERARVRG